MTVKIINALNLQGVLWKTPLVSDLQNSNKPFAVLVGDFKEGKSLLAISTSGSQTENITVYSKKYLEDSGLNFQIISYKPYSIAFIKPEDKPEPKLEINFVIANEEPPVEEIVEDFPIPEAPEIEESSGLDIEEENLEDLKKSELIDIANSLGLEFSEKSKKSELIELINSNS